METPTWVRIVDTIVVCRRVRIGESSVVDIQAGVKAGGTGAMVGVTGWGRHMGRLQHRGFSTVKTEGRSFSAGDPVQGRPQE
ncbi:hypothetical protein FKM82_030237 [Ascaphus truei]